MANKRGVKNAADAFPLPIFQAWVSEMRRQVESREFGEETAKNCLNHFLMFIHWVMSTENILEERDADGTTRILLDGSEEKAQERLHRLLVEKGNVLATSYLQARFQELGEPGLKSVRTIGVSIRKAYAWFRGNGLCTLESESILSPVVVEKKQNSLPVGDAWLHDSGYTHGVLNCRRSQFFRYFSYIARELKLTISFERETAAYQALLSADATRRQEQNVPEMRGTLTEEILWKAENHTRAFGLWLADAPNGSRDSIRGDISAIRNFYHWAFERGFTEFNANSWVNPLNEKFKSGRAKKGKRSVPQNEDDAESCEPPPGARGEAEPEGRSKLLENEHGGSKPPELTDDVELVLPQPSTDESPQLLEEVPTVGFAILAPTTRGDEVRRSEDSQPQQEPANEIEPVEEIPQERERSETPHPVDIEVPLPAGEDSVSDAMDSSTKSGGSKQTESTPENVPPKNTKGSEKKSRGGKKQASGELRESEGRGVRPAESYFQARGDLNMRTKVHRRLPTRDPNGKKFLVPRNWLVTELLREERYEFTLAHLDCLLRSDYDSATGRLQTHTEPKGPKIIFTPPPMRQKFNEYLAALSYSLVQKERRKLWKDQPLFLSLDGGRLLCDDSKEAPIMSSKFYEVRNEIVRIFIRRQQLPFEEVVGIRRFQIDMGKKELSSSYQTIPLHPELVPLLFEYLELVAASGLSTRWGSRSLDGPLLLSSDGEEITADDLLS